MLVFPKNAEKNASTIEKGLAGSHDESRGFAYKTRGSFVLYFNVFRLRSPGALWRKRAKYLQTHIQVVLIAAKPH